MTTTDEYDRRAGVADAGTAATLAALLWEGALGSARLILADLSEGSRQTVEAIGQQLAALAAECDRDGRCRCGRKAHAGEVGGFCCGFCGIYRGRRHSMGCDNRLRAQRSAT